MIVKQNGFNILLKSFAYISLGIGVVLLLYYAILAFVEIDKFEFSKLNRYVCTSLKDNPGEFVGGTIGTFFTLTGTLFLFVTFREQRKQFDSTKSSEFYTRFETTYFNMLGMLEKVQASINKNISESSNYPNQYNLIDYYNTLKYIYVRDSSRKEEINGIEEALSHEPLQAAEVLKAKQVYGDYFESYVKEANCNVGYFYRYIYNIVNFVCSQTEFKNEYDKEKYLNILQAQLSDEELAFIFYDAISKYGENKDGRQKFHDMLDETHFLENIRPEVLLSRKHCFFYPQTSFKFMSMDERRMAKMLLCH